MTATPTIADVANAAGVSKATVSRVLSGSSTYMRAETRQRVEQAILSLGYRPSSVARSLTSKRTYTLAIVISDVGNPFYADVIHGVEDVAAGHGYSLFLGNTNYDLPRGLQLIRSLVDRRVDGVMIMSSSMSDEWLDELARGGIPAVVLDWAVQVRGLTTGAITVDFAPGIAAAVSHLWELGHRRFAHLSGPLSLPTSIERRDTFLQALAAYGIRPDAVPVLEGDLSIEGGRSALPRLLQLPQRPTAVFAANDLLAIGLINAARSHGVRVPEQLSIAGLDDIWLAGQVEPALTTVALPRYEIGALAARMLLGLLNATGPEAEPPRCQVATHLVVRASTAPPAS